MKKILLLSAFVSTLASCSRHGDKKQAGDFHSWFKERNFTAHASAQKAVLRTLVVESEALRIDTIYRSMQGPVDLKMVRFDEDENELLWLTGYSSEIIDANTGSRLSDEFMCHNNLEIADKKNFPWKLQTIGSNIRVFTLTEGQTRIQLPEGYGIPFPASEKLALFSQILNHNIRNPHLQVKHRVTIAYYRQSELTVPLVPLYQQAAFITEKTSGPAGQYGLSPADTVMQANGKADTSCDAHCWIRYDKGGFNPYADAFGRKYTGHWKLPCCRQVLHTDVTPMLNLPYDTRAHFIGVHVHPFCTSLELRDATTDSSLFKAEVKNFTDRTGIEKIASFSSSEGIALYKDHRYQLISEYNCTDSTAQHTAMATMFLYLEERKQ